MFNKTLFNGITLLNLMFALIIFAFAIILARIISLYTRRTFKEKINKNHLELIIKVIWYSIIILAFISVLSILGVNPAGILAAGGIAGIVIGFASQNIVSNLISGIFIIIERPIKIGDQVNIGEIAGFVEDISIISTNIRKYDGLFVRIPNEKVFTSNITNFVAHVARRFEYVVGIRYSDDADKAVQIIKDVVNNEPLALKNPEPHAFVDNLGDNSVNIFVRIWAPITEWYNIKAKLLWEIKKALEREGIEIAFPQRVVWFANESEKRELKDSYPIKRSE